MKTWGELFSALNNTEREVDVYTENWLNSYSELSSVYYSPSELNYYSLKLSNVFIKDREYDDEFKVGLGVSSVFMNFDHSGREKEEDGDWDIESDTANLDMLHAFHLMSEEDLENSIKEHLNIENQLNSYIGFLEGLGVEKNFISFKNVMINGKDEGLFQPINKDVLKRILDKRDSEHILKLMEDKTLLNDDEINLLNELNLKKKQILINSDLNNKKEILDFVRETLRMYMSFQGEEYLGEYLEKDKNKAFFREIVLLSKVGNKQEKTIKKKI